MLTLRLTNAACGAAWAEVIYTKRGQRYTFTKKQPLVAEQQAEFLIESATHVFLRVGFGAKIRRFLIECPFEATLQLAERYLTLSYAKALNPAQFCLKFVHVPNVFRTLQIGDYYKEFSFRQNPKQLIDGLLLASNICFMVSGVSLEVCNPQSGLYAIQAGSKTVYFELLSVKKDSVQTGEKNAEIIQLARKNEHGGYSIDLHGQAISSPLSKISSYAAGLYKSLRGLERHSGTAIEASIGVLPHFADYLERSVETTSFSVPEIYEPRQPSILHYTTPEQRYFDAYAQEMSDVAQNYPETKPPHAQYNGSFGKQLSDQPSRNFVEMLPRAYERYMAKKAAENIQQTGACLQSGAEQVASESSRNDVALEHAQSQREVVDTAKALPPVETRAYPRRSTSTSVICEAASTEICATDLATGNFSAPQKLSKLPRDFGFKGAERADSTHKAKPGLTPALMSVGRPNYALLSHSRAGVLPKKASAELCYGTNAPAETVIRYSGFQNVCTGQTKLAGEAVDRRLVQNRGILSEKCRNLLLRQK